MTANNKLAGVYVLVDQPSLNASVVIAGEALAGGADIIQLRSKHLDPDDRLRLAGKLRTMTSAAGRPFIINDDVELAVESGADGVHLGPRDAAVKEVRDRHPDRLIVGASVGTVKDALEAEAAGADYLGVGPVYETASKHDARPVLGLPALGEICRAVEIPVFAIGGINLPRAPEVLAAGAAGMAVISAISLSPDARSTVRAFREVHRQFAGVDHVFN